ncbi:MAG: DciA family protein [Actinomycetes bacterium]
MKHDLARELYKTWRNNSKRSKNNPTDEVRERVEDPQKLNTVLNDLITARDWKQGIAEGTLFTDWVKVVGDEVAQHATPITLIDGLLTIQTSSTAWATQLTAMAPSLLKQISSSAPGALVESLSIIGPNAPSWKKGLRTIKNHHGPRDTYG